MAKAVLSGHLKSFLRDRRGGMATIFGIALPAIAVLGCGAADLASVASDKAKMQDVADAAALNGANQLSVANSQGAADRAQQFANDQLTEVAKRVALKTLVSVTTDARSMTVTIQGHRASFFGNLLPIGGWNFNIESTAQPLGKMPLCVLSTGGPGDASGAIGMQNQSQTTAANCLVHSNSDLSVPSPANLTAGTAEAVGSATGQISPAPQTGAPAIPDPFSGLNLGIPTQLCNPLDLVYDVGVNIVTPGVHCGNMTVQQNATAILLPGVHYFVKGNLTLKQSATLQGDNVVLIFDDNSSFQFQDQSQIKLQGRKTGTFAGFVIATTPANTNTFTISSDAARLLLGTIYIPNATLSVSGGQIDVADQSAWTVIVARGLKLSGSPNLVINSDYAGSSVPTPTGVGPSSQGARLVK